MSQNQDILNQQNIYDRFQDFLKKNPKNTQLINIFYSLRELLKIWNGQILIGLQCYTVYWGQGCWNLLSIFFRKTHCKIGIFKSVVVSAIRIYRQIFRSYKKSWNRRTMLNLLWKKKICLINRLSTTKETLW